ncbi:hypothetical protein V1478_017329 [Vespula squamosa]|uniref:Uncharacterized protein n=1 Tax=Vespula squamosa TaxID=30214 RepID=A0ABD1ZY81_VESSQ
MLTLEMFVACLPGKPDAFPPNDFSLPRAQASSASVPSSGSGKSTGRPRVITTPTAPCPTSDELDALCSSLDQGCKVARRAEGGFRLSASGPDKLAEFNEGENRAKCAKYRISSCPERNTKDTKLLPAVEEELRSSARQTNVLRKEQQGGVVSLISETRC